MKKINWISNWIWIDEKEKEGFHFCYFRKSFNLDKVIEAKIYCAADSKYRLFINGRYAGTGPCRGKSDSPYYDEYSVRLKKGKNTVSFLVEHYTKPTKIFSAVEGGLICQIEDSEGILVKTDNSWKVKTAEAYTILDGRNFPECFDSNLEPVDWQNIEFDDSSWKNATVKIETKLACPEKFIPRPIPMLTDRIFEPEKILDIYGVSKETDDFLDRDKISQTLWSATHL